MEKYLKNIKIYKVYKMFSYDLLFFQSIYMLYFTIVKHFSVSDVIYVGAVFSLFSFIWQMPANYFIEKFGLKKSIIFGNILICLEIIGYLFVKTSLQYGILEMICSFGWALKSIAEADLLYSSMKVVKKEKEFATVEGKALSRYYFYDAITAILSGFLFIINGYLPMILCLIHITISLLISFKFTDLKNESEDKVTLKDVAKQFLDIIHIKRSKSILIFTLIFAGIVAVSRKLYNAILIDLEIPEQYISIILCFATISIGIGSKFFYRIEKVTRKKTLKIFSIIYILALLGIGVIGIIHKVNVLTIMIYLILLLFIGITYGGYSVGIKKYVLNFTTSKVRTKMTTLYYFFRYVGQSIFLFISAKILEHFNEGLSTVIFGIFAAICLILILNYMKGKFGLNPEEYNKEEIYGIEITKK